MTNLFVCSASRIVWLGTFLIGLNVQGFAAEITAPNWCGMDSPNPIDAQLAASSNNPTNMGTVDIRKAQGIAYKQWEGEVKNLYSKLYSMLNDKDKKLLEKSQLAWGKYVDSAADFLYSDAVLDNFLGRGSLASVAVSDWGLEMQKRRACVLHNFIQLIQGKEITPIQLPFPGE